MKTLVISIVVFSLISVAGYAQEAGRDVGAISGRIVPTGASIKIIAKTAGTEDVKGEVLLPRGGDFIIEKLPAGKYDLLFFLLGDSASKYIATRWSEIIVQPGKIVTGINYRLTPIESDYLLDEIIVAFNKNLNTEEITKLISSERCIVKDTPDNMGEYTSYLIHIPNDKNVIDMIRLFKDKKGIRFAEHNWIIRMHDPMPSKITK
jgi:hypothetical protein